MPRYISLVQGSKEWLEFRRSHIGGSDAGIIMGVNPWTTPYQLWEQKVIGKEVPENEAMSRGKRLEPIARDLYIEMTGIYVKPAVCIHVFDLPWMMASLDGISICDDLVVTGIEIKCAGITDHELAKLGYIPEKYVPQCQHILEVCGLDEMDYFSFDGKEGVIVKVKRDQSYIDEMVKKEYEFWQRIQNLDPPDLTEKDYKIMDDMDWAIQSDMFFEAKRQKMIWQEKEDRARHLIIQMADGKNCIGSDIRVQRVISKGRVQYDCIPELKDIDLEPYRKPKSESWKITEC